MERFDLDSNVLHWCSEELFVPYYDPSSRKQRRYFPDFIIQIKTEYGTKVIMIEVKPKKQTSQPKKPASGRTTRRYISECLTYKTNEAKWEAAQNYCDLKGWTFQILTEDEIF